MDIFGLGSGFYGNCPLLSALPRHHKWWVADPHVDGPDASFEALAYLNITFNCEDKSPDMWRVTCIFVTKSGVLL